MPLLKDLKDEYMAFAATAGIDSSEAEAAWDKVVPKSYGVGASYAPEKSQGFLSSLGEQLDPRPVIELAKKLLPRSDDPMGIQRSTAIWQVIKGLTEATTKPAGEAWGDLKAGEYQSALARGLEAVPIVGPIGEKMADQFEQGDYGGAIGTGLGAGITFAGPSALSKLGKTKLLGRQSLAAEAQLVDGIPVAADVATGTRGGKIAGSFLSRGAETTIGGRWVNEIYNNSVIDKFRNKGTRLNQSISIIDPLRAGENAIIAGKQTALGILREAEQLYQPFNKAKIDPNLIEKVKVGEKYVDTGLINPTTKSPIMRLENIEESMIMPVDIIPARIKLRPIYDEYKRLGYFDDPQASAAVREVKQLMEGVDFIPASTAKNVISNLNGIIRDTESSIWKSATTKEGTIARIGVPELKSALEKTAMKAGKDVYESLIFGNERFAQGSTVRSAMEKMKSGPVEFFDQLTKQRGKGINELYLMDQVIPDQIKGIGQGWMKEVLTKEKPWDYWDKLHIEHKSKLFDPTLINPYDDLFAVWKETVEKLPGGLSRGIMERGVSTGTAGLGIWELYHPLFFAIHQVAGIGVMLMLRSPAGVKLLTQGMKASTRSAIVKSLWTAKALQEIERIKQNTQGANP